MLQLQSTEDLDQFLQEAWELAKGELEVLGKVSWWTAFLLGNGIVSVQ